MIDVVTLGKSRGTVKVTSCRYIEDAAFRERTWGNLKDLLHEWTKCRTDIACLLQKPWIMARPKHSQSCTGHDS